MAALFVHVVEVFMQRKKVLYSALCCWLGGSCFCKVRGHMSSMSTYVQHEDQRKEHLVPLLFQWGGNSTCKLDIR